MDTTLGEEAESKCASLSTTKGHAQFAGGGGSHHLNELARRCEEMLLPAQYDTVGPVGKKPIERDSHEPLIAGKTYIGDDRDSKAHLNIFFDDFPASRFEGHVVRDAMLLEHRFAIRHVARCRGGRISP